MKKLFLFIILAIMLIGCYPDLQTVVDMSNATDGYITEPQAPVVQKFEYPTSMPPFVTTEPTATALPPYVQITPTPNFTTPTSVVPPYWTTSLPPTMPVVAPTFVVPVIEPENRTCTNLLPYIFYPWLCK